MTLKWSCFACSTETDIGTHFNFSVVRGKHCRNSQGKYRTAVLKLNGHKDYLRVIKNTFRHSDSIKHPTLTHSYSIEETTLPSGILSDLVGLGWTLKISILRVMLCDFDAGSHRQRRSAIEKNLMTVTEMLAWCYFSRN